MSISQPPLLYLKTVVNKEIFNFNEDEQLAFIDAIDDGQFEVSDQMATLSSLSQCTQLADQVRIAAKLKALSCGFPPPLPMFGAVLALASQDPLQWPIYDARAHEEENQSVNTDVDSLLRKRIKREQAQSQEDETRGSLGSHHMDETEVELAVDDGNFLDVFPSLDDAAALSAAIDFSALSEETMVLGLARFSGADASHSGAAHFFASAFSPWIDCHVASLSSRALFMALLTAFSAQPRAVRESFLLPLLRAPVSSAGHLDLLGKLLLEIPAQVCRELLLVSLRSFEFPPPSDSSSLRFTIQLLLAVIQSTSWQSRFPATIISQVCKVLSHHNEIGLDEITLLFRFVSKFPQDCKDCANQLDAQLDRATTKNFMLKAAKKKIKQLK